MWSELIISWGASHDEGELTRDQVGAVWLPQHVHHGTLISPAGGAPLAHVAASWLGTVCHTAAVEAPVPTDAIYLTTFLGPGPELPWAEYVLVAWPGPPVLLHLDGLHRMLRWYTDKEIRGPTDTLRVRIARPNNLLSHTVTMA